MPVVDLGKGKVLTIKRIRMTSHAHAQYRLSNNLEKRKLAALHMKVDFENYGYWSIEDSKGEDTYIVRVPKDRIEGTTNELSQRMIREYLAAQGRTSILVPEWKQSFGAKVTDVDMLSIIFFPSEPPEADIDRIFIHTFDNPQCTRRIQFGVLQHKRFK